MDCVVEREWLMADLGGNFWIYCLKKGWGDEKLGERAFINSLQL